LALDRDRAHKTLLERAPLVPKGVFAALGVGVAFGLGIVAGGGMGRARGEAAMVTGDVLARAEERAKLLDEKRGTLRLTYGNELVKPEAVVVERPIEKQAGVKATPDAHASSTSASPPADDGAAPLEAPPAPMPEQKLAAVKVNDEAADDDVEKAPAPAEKQDPARLQVALAKVLGTPPAAVDAKPVAKSFALQVASSPTRQGAEELLKKLTAAGHKARIVEGDVGGKAVFRVRVGSFADRAAADAAKGKLSMPAFVVAE
jgi:cell division septation protein DedD